MATRAADKPRSDAAALSSALARIADFWGLSNAKLGTVLGLSPATVSRIRGGKTLLDPSSKSFEAGQFVLRLFRDCCHGALVLIVVSGVPAPALNRAVVRERV